MGWDFGPQVQDFVDRAKGRLQALGPGVAVQLAKSAIANTPIGTVRAKAPHASEPDPHPGELRNSWKAAINGEPIGEAGSGGIEQIEAVAAECGPGDTITIANVAPYANKVEMGWGGKERYSPPHQMLGRTLMMADYDAFTVIRQIAPDS